MPMPAIVPAATAVPAPAPAPAPAAPAVPPEEVPAALSAVAVPASPAAADPLDSAPTATLENIGDTVSTRDRKLETSLLFISTLNIFSVLTKFSKFNLRPLRLRRSELSCNFGSYQGHLNPVI